MTEVLPPSPQPEPLVFEIRFEGAAVYFEAPAGSVRRSWSEVTSHSILKLRARFEAAIGEEASFHEVGLDLFDTLFPPDSAGLQLLRQSQEMVVEQDRLLAYRCVGPGDTSGRSAWFELPWEYLFDRRGNEFMVLHPRATFSRVTPRDQKNLPGRALREILWLGPPVDTSRFTEGLILRGSAGPQVRVRLSTGRDLEAGKAGPVDILHVEASAELDEAGQLSLILAEQHRWLPHELFEAVGKPPPRLLYFRSLNGRYRTAVARAALQWGAAAAVGLQMPMPRAEAPHFERTFYHGLQAGQSVELAMAEARKRLFNDFPASPAWGAPTLWLQDPAQPLFRFDGDGLEDVRGPHLLRRLSWTPATHAVLRGAIDYLDNVNAKRAQDGSKPRRLSSSILLLALADPLKLHADQIDLAFFRQCLDAPYDGAGPKSLDPFLERWEDAPDDLNRLFDEVEALPGVTDNATAILQRAAQWAEQTSDGTVGVRHLLAALVTEDTVKAGETVEEETGDTESDRPPFAWDRLRRAGHRLKDLRLRLFDHVRQKWPNDRQDVWRWLLVGPQTQLISRFADDQPRGTDRLFVEPYARALAAVVAAWETPQPLSIGIFGDWGSGKSFFMHLLSDAIADLKHNDARDRLGRRIFCRNIVQIDFNAWHYAESQIWASLVDHILRSLYKPLGEAETQEKLRRLELIGIAKVEAEARLEQAEAALEAAEKERQRRLRSGEEIWRVRFWESLPEEMVPDNVRQGLETLQDAVGFREILSYARLAYRQMRGLERYRTGFLAIVKHLWRHPRRPVLAAALVLTVLFVLRFTNFQHWFDSVTWQIIGHQIAGSLALLVAGLMPIVGVVRSTWRQLTQVRDWLQSNHRHLDTELRRQLEDYHENVEAARRKVTALEAERDAARRELEAAQTPESFSRFLRQRMSDNPYSEHLGVISAVHNDFRTLSNLLLEKAQERRRAKDDGSVDDHHVDRIVLYIDDLDRCPSSTVVQVLEAIHLLLAFDLFVVVVGVDVRWVAQSLADRYPRHLQNAREDDVMHAPESSQEWYHKATPHDYLEKIFQIPFWLPPMGPQASRNLIRALTAAPSEAVESSVAKTTEPIPDLWEEDDWGAEALGAPIHLMSSAEVDPSDGPDELAVDTAEGPVDSRSQAEDLEKQEGKETLEMSSSSEEKEDEDLAAQAETTEQQKIASARALIMSEGEVAYMEELASAVGRSPRRLKRFVNVYRILKASCTPSEALRFVHESGQGGEYRAAMTLLVLTTGAPSLATDLYRLLLRQAPDVAVRRWLEALEEYSHLHEAEPKEAAAVHHAFALYERFEGEDAPLRQLQKWARRVVRFTFRSGRD